MAAFHRYPSVSYTHLDVYKRQASAGGEPARVQQSISHTHCRDGFSYSHTLCAVSYTHLDVYKRQHLPESQEQNLVVVEAFLEAAKRYAHGGYDVIVDGIIGPWFLAQMCIRDRCKCPCSNRRYLHRSRPYQP